MLQSAKGSIPKYPSPHFIDLCPPFFFSVDLIKLELQRGLTSSIIESGGINGFSAQATKNTSDAVASGTMAGMHVDWRETAEGHVIKADLPGVRKEEVRVDLERGGVQIITGERHREEETQGDTWRQVERSSGKITRRLQLPENARMEGVKASMEHGVLTVLVPKSEPLVRNEPAPQLNAGQ